MGNSQVNGEFPIQRPVTRSFDVLFDLRQSKRLSAQSWGWWFEVLSRQLWRHCYDFFILAVIFILCFSVLYVIVPHCNEYFIILCNFSKWRVFTVTSPHECRGVSNHRQRHFFKSLFRLIKRSQCFALLTLFVGKPLLSSRSPLQEASNAENVTMPSRHYVTRANYTHFRHVPVARGITSVSCLSASMNQTTTTNTYNCSSIPYEFSSSEWCVEKKTNANAFAQCGLPLYEHYQVEAYPRVSSK